MMQANDPYARPDPGQATAGIATGAEQFYATLLPVGSIIWRLAPSKEAATREMPGWFVADGTQPPLVIDGTSYTPNLSKRVVMGADGSAGFTGGATGGSDSHVHPFTQPNNHVVTQPTAHVITQPVLANHPNVVHDANHTETQPTAHGAHSYSIQEFTATGLLTSNSTGYYALVGFGTGQTGAKTYAHDNNHAGVDVLGHSDHPAETHSLTTQVGLSNNHAGTAVDPHAGGAVLAATGDNKYPPYLAAWPLVKVYA